MQLIQNIHASTSTYTALTRWLRYTCTHTCTHSLYSHLPVCSSPPSLWCSCSKLSWALMEGLSRWHRQPTLIFYWTLFVLFILRRRCAATHGLTHSFRLKWSNIPSRRERVIQTYEKKWCGKWFGLFLFLPFKFHFTNTWRRLVMFALLSLSTGILKFHEVYLGEGVSEGGSEFQEGSGGGVISGSSLEQHIASAREALGVESYYSRWDVHSCHGEIKIPCLLAHYLYDNMLI